jgi:hypothetical protein
MTEQVVFKKCNAIHYVLYLALAISMLVIGDQYNKEDLCRLDAPYCLLVLGGLTLGLSVGGKYFIKSSFLTFSYIFFIKKSSHNWP